MFDYSFKRLQKMNIDHNSDKAPVWVLVISSEVRFIKRLNAKEAGEKPGVQLVLYEI